MVFGPRDRRITRLIASPNGRYLACHHVPENYSTDDYHYLFFAHSGDGYVELGEPPPAPPLGGGYPGTMERSDFAALDRGEFVFLETNHRRVELARYAATPQGLAEVARWKVWSASSLNGTTLCMLPSGDDALVLVDDRDDKDADWGGGQPPAFTQTWLRVNLGSGAVCEIGSATGANGISLEEISGARGGSVLMSLGTEPSVRKEEPVEGAALRKLLSSLSLAPGEFAIHAGCTHLLTNLRVIEIASGATLLQLEDDQSHLGRMRVYPRFHDLSSDESYALSTVAGGHFELWNIARRSSWRPSLPAHGGVHCAIFLPGARAALGTAEGGVIVVDWGPGMK